MRISYICDRLKCEDKYGGKCPGEYCQHTTDITHAVNFIVMYSDDGEILGAIEGEQDPLKSE